VKAALKGGLLEGATMLAIESSLKTNLNNFAGSFNLPVFSYFSYTSHFTSCTSYVVDLIPVMGSSQKKFLHVRILRFLRA